MRTTTILLSASLLVTVPAFGQTTVDDFGDPQGPLTTTSTSVVAQSSGTILGGERDLATSITGDGGRVEVTAGGVFEAASNPGTSSATGDLSWDGTDGNATIIDDNGLGGLDLTAGGVDAFTFVVDQATAGSSLLVRLFSGLGNQSRFGWTLPEITSPTVVVVPFDKLVVFNGSGGDTTAAGAITLQLDVFGGGTTSISGPFATATAAPVITATQADLTGPAGAEIGTDPEIPGGSFTYTVTIRNTGDDATSVSLSDALDINLSQDGAFRSTPVAIPDSYSGCGNVTLAADGSAVGLEGLLNNDDPVDGDTLSVVSIQSPTDQGGTTTLDDAATGRFTYLPPAGFGGTDTFTYVVQDTDGNQVTGTASVDLSAATVWFVDSSSVGTDVGTQANPFVDLNDLNGTNANVDGAGDVIVMHDGAGTYSGGLPLEDDQQLYGANSTLLPCDLAPTGTRPAIGNSGGIGLLLAANNTVDQIDVNGTSTAGIGGTSVGTLAISNASVAGADGTAVTLSSGTVNVTFDSLESIGTSSNDLGIDLDALNGTFTVTGTTSLTDAHVTAIEVSNSTGGAFDFGAVTITDTVGGGAFGDGVDLSIGNNGTTFSFDSLSVTTDGGVGLRTNNSGSVTILGDPRSIVATGGPALDITSTTVSGFTFTSLSSTNSTTRGLNLDSVTGAVVGNGGSINGSTGIAVDINGGSDTVTYAGSISNASSKTAEITGRTGGAVTLSGAISHTAATVGIDVNGNSGGTSSFSGASKVINSQTATAVSLVGNTGHAVRFTGGGLDVDTSGASTAFSAASGGGVEVTGAGNTINTTNSGGTGTAVNISDVPIIGSGVTFERIDVTGATNGIVLSNTGSSAGFTVTGDSGSAVNGSGGTLANIAGSAILLTDTTSFAMDQLDMTNVADHGISGIRVNGLSVSNATFTTMGNAETEDVFGFDRDTFGDNGLTGTALFQNLTVTGFAERAIDIVNEGTGSLDLDVLDVSASDNNDTFGEDAIRVQNEGSVNANVFVSGGTYDNLELDVLAYFAQGSGSNTVELTGVTSTNGGGPDDNPNGGGVAIIGSAGSTTTFDINVNNLTGVQGAVVQIIGLPGPGQTVTLNGTIGGPTLADANTLSSDNADGLDLDFDGDPGGGSSITGSIVVENNTISFDDDGIGVDFRDAAGTMNITIRGNTLNGIAGGDSSTADIDDGIFVFTDDDVSAAVNQLNVEIDSNQFNGVDASRNVIEIVDVQNGNKVCFGATGNSIGSGSGSIELDTAAMADLVVDATSAANLSTLNNSIPVSEVATPTYNSAVDCIP